MSNLPSVFKLNSRPWITTHNAADTEELINTMIEYLSGTLRYSLDSIGYRDQNEMK